MKAKLIIWSLSISIRWDELSNHPPHADKVSTAAEVNLSTLCRAIFGANEFSLRSFPQQESHCNIHSLLKLELNSVEKRLLDLNL